MQPIDGESEKGKLELLDAAFKNMFVVNGLESHIIKAIQKLFEDDKYQVIMLSRPYDTQLNRPVKKESDCLSLMVFRKNEQTYYSIDLKFLNLSRQKVYDENKVPVSKNQRHSQQSQWYLFVDVADYRYSDENSQCIPEVNKRNVCNEVTASIKKKLGIKKSEYHWVAQIKENNMNKKGFYLSPSKLRLRNETAYRLLQ